MKRGDLHVVKLSGDYGKPRPAVVVQSDRFLDLHPSVIVCPITSAAIAAPLFRIDVAASAANGLKQPSQIMVDKIVTVRRDRIGDRIGSLDAETRVRLDRSIATFLGLAD
ncbi:MAG: type II toxin-antitoxin system PemK/MazF family toxin [Alphaproteobacteria bacterium]|nr:type II toxin-antitoxin system PemK/MazF family toxin [Alphaproteobacteria bacterium]